MNSRGSEKELVENGLLKIECKEALSCLKHGELLACEICQVNEELSEPKCTTCGHVFSAMPITDSGNIRKCMSIEVYKKTGKTFFATNIREIPESVDIAPTTALPVNNLSDKELKLAWGEIKKISFSGDTHSSLPFSASIALYRAALNHPYMTILIGLSALIDWHLREISRDSIFTGCLIIFCIALYIYPLTTCLRRYNIILADKEKEEKISPFTKEAIEKKKALLKDIYLSILNTNDECVEKINAARDSCNEAYAKKNLQIVLIRDADIAGIGESLVEDLMAHKINNAYDVLNRNLEEIPGFGESRIEALKAWAASHIKIMPYIDTNPDYITAVNRIKINMEKEKEIKIQKFYREKEELISAFEITVVKYRKFISDVDAITLTTKNFGIFRPWYRMFLTIIIALTLMVRFSENGEVAKDAAINLHQQKILLSAHQEPLSSDQQKQIIEKQSLQIQPRVVNPPYENITEIKIIEKKLSSVASTEELPEHSSAPLMIAAPLKKINTNHFAYKEALINAEDCFKNKDYDCTISHAEDAVRYMPSSKEATLLKRTAEIEKQNQAFREDDWQVR